MSRGQRLAAICNTMLQAGFGTRLIDTSIRGLGGAIRRNWQRGHLACEITLPRDQVFVAHSGE